MVNNALPLIAAITSIAAGEPPGQREPPPDIGFLEAFWSHSLVELTLFLPFLLITVLALWRSSVRERRVINEELAGEAAYIVSPQEYQEGRDDPILQTRRIDPRSHRASAALVNAQHELGLRKRRGREEGNDPKSDDLAAGWREDIRRLRAFIPA